MARGRVADYACRCPPLQYEALQRRAGEAQELFCLRSPLLHGDVIAYTDGGDDTGGQHGDTVSLAKVTIEQRTRPLVALLFPDHPVHGPRCRQQDSCRLVQFVMID